MNPDDQEVPEPEGSPANDDGPRVLIVDDDTTFRTATRKMLEETGFHIIGEVGWGELGSTLAEAIAPDVVLMDYRMPSGDGISATRSIKAVLPLTQVVMLSAYDDTEIKQEAQAAGIFAYISKGSPPRLVRQALLDAWEHKRQLDLEAARDEPMEAGA